MLTTVEAEIDVGGKVRLLEPLEVTRTTRAIVTLLEDNGNGDGSGNAAGMLEFLRSNRLPKDARPDASSIDSRIEEARESWD
jgi:hypothetical protein